MAKIELPKICPCCGSSTIMEGQYLVCPNHEDCPDQTQYRIVHYLHTLDVKGFGEKIVEKLFDAGLINDIPDLYIIDLMKFSQLEGMSEKVVNKIMKELLTKTKEVALPRFIKAISLRSVSESFAEVIMTKYPTLTDMYTATEEELVKIDRIGDSIARDFVKGINSRREMIEKITRFVKIIYAKSDGPLAGKIFCFTGFRSAEYETIIKNMGGKMSSSVTKATTHLVCADMGSGSIKAKKAKEEGKEVIGVEELKKLLEV